MPNNKKHIKPFWAIASVVTVALVAAGLIFYYSFNNQLQDDLYSISFSSPIHITKTLKKTPEAKTAPTRLKTPTKTKK